MSIRFANSGDHRAIQGILEYCFSAVQFSGAEGHAPEPANQEPETEEMRREKEEALTWVLVKEEADGRLGQHVQIVPLTIHFDGALHAMAGIGGVASLPEYRYGGGVMELLRYALQVMHERHIAFSELAPFSFAFYRKCGYEWGFRWHKLSIPMSELAQFRADKGNFVSLTEAHKEQAFAVRNLHGARFNGAERLEPVKKETFPPKNHLAYGVMGEDGALSGYAVFQIKENTIRCRDFFYRDIQAKRQLLHFFHRHNSQAETLILTVPETDTTLHLLGNQYLDVKAEAGMMVRVVDVPAALAAMKISPDLAGGFILQISDEMAPWNQGNWLVTVAEGRLKAERIEDREPDCMLSIQRLSQLVYGFVDGSELTDSGMAEWRNDGAKALFHQVFRKRPTAQWIGF